MKLTLATDEGILVDVIEGVEAWDLERPFARSAFMEEICGMIRVAKRWASEEDKLPCFTEEELVMLRKE